MILSEQVWSHIPTTPAFDNIDWLEETAWRRLQWTGGGTSLQVNRQAVKSRVFGPELATQQVVMPKEKPKKVTGIYIWWLCKQWFYGVLCMTVSTMSIPHCRKWNQSCSSFWDKSYLKWSPWGTRLSAASAGGFSVPLPVRTPFELVKFQLIRLWKKLSDG